MEVRLQVVSMTIKSWFWDYNTLYRMKEKEVSLYKLKMQVYKLRYPILGIY